MNLADLERFEAKAERTANGCLLWTASTNNKGYGWFYWQGRRHLAHRVAYEHHHGPIPFGVMICHTCDTPACVEPGHLWPGDNGQNIRDAVAKGRWEWARPLAAGLVLPDDRRLRGERHGRAKMTAEQVHEVRRRVAAGENQYRLAEEFGVTQAAIWYAGRGRTWKSLPPEPSASTTSTART